MKVSLGVMMMFFATLSQAAESPRLNFDHPITLSQIKTSNVLPGNFLNLYRPYREKRMIAGKFEAIIERKTYLDGLRSRLKNFSGFQRF